MRLQLSLPWQYRSFHWFELANQMPRIRPRARPCAIPLILCRWMARQEGEWLSSCNGQSRATIKQHANRAVARPAFVRVVQELRILLQSGGNRMAKTWPLDLSVTTPAGTSAPATNSLTRRLCPWSQRLVRPATLYRRYLCDGCGLSLPGFAYRQLKSAGTSSRFAGI